MFKKQRTISWVLLLTILIGLLPIQVFANDNNSKTNIDCCAFEYKTTSDWGSGFNGEITITNTSQKTIENWAISFDFEYQITSFWTADLVSHKGNSYVIKNKGWNADIKPGASVKIGFGGSPGNINKKPSNYALVSKRSTSANSEYDVQFNVTNDWKQGFNGNITITNKTQKPIEDWILEFDFNKEISNFWTADIINHVGNHYIIENRGYNSIIAPGSKLSLGLVNSWQVNMKLIITYYINIISNDHDDATTHAYPPSDSSPSQQRSFTSNRFVTTQTVPSPSTRFVPTPTPFVTTPTRSVADTTHTSRRNVLPTPTPIPSPTQTDPAAQRFRRDRRRFVTDAIVQPIHSVTDAIPSPTQPDSVADPSNSSPTPRTTQLRHRHRR